MTNSGSVKKKVFVSYKYGDCDVQDLGERYRAQHDPLARDYVNYLAEHAVGDVTYTGEAVRDLGGRPRDEIRDYLQREIHLSTITVVLMSPNMRDAARAEDQQWIPWEIAHALRDNHGMLAVALPDRQGSYGYYMDADNGQGRYDGPHVKRERLFRILSRNMENLKPALERNPPKVAPIQSLHDRSFITSVTWEDFLETPAYWLNVASQLRLMHDRFNLVQEI